MIYYLSLFLIVVGVFFLFTGTLGILRFPDFFSRLHAASLSDSFGAPLILMGLALFFNVVSIILKIVVLVMVLWVSSATTEYVISKAKFKENDDYNC